jgi:DNA-binding NtrC family response regulator
VSLKEAVEEYEREMILRALSHSGGVQKRAAELLRIRPTTLNEMIKRLGIGSRREELSLSGGSEE